MPPKAYMPCLKSGVFWDGHRRGKCRDCRAVYVRAHKKTEKGMATARKNYRDIASTRMNLAKMKLANAVKRGRVPRAQTLACVDCGVQAQCYDHRDYLKPLDVVPVCHRCNKRRGPGKNRDF